MDHRQPTQEPELPGAPTSAPGHDTADGNGGHGASRRDFLKTAAGTAAGVAATAAVPTAAAASSQRMRAPLTAAHSGRRRPSATRGFPKIRDEFMISPDAVVQWAKFKATQCGPTYAGSPGWAKYMDFLVAQAKRFGAVDLDSIDIPYERYVVNDWPDPRTHIYGSGVEVEKLISNGRPVPVVASYGMTSGFTGPDGITAEMIYYDPARPPTAAQIKGKILVFKTVGYPEPPYTDAFLDSYTMTDYEFRTPGQWWPLYTPPPASVMSSYHSRWVWSQMNGFASIGVASGAAGMVVVYDLSPGAAFGLTQRTVYTPDGKAGPGTKYVNCPTLCLDRVNGAKVLRDAQAGKTATLTLIASFEHSVGRGVVGYLPGKDYGTARDQQVLLATHTDSMSLVEEDGGFGILAILYYYNHFRQADRPRTLAFYFDSRHFMPGGETAWPQYDYFLNHPEKLKPMVAGIGMEHMGGRQTIEIGPGGNDYVYSPEGPNSGGLITSLIDVYNNNIWLIQKIAEAATDNNWPRVDAKAASTEPGINGGFQGAVKSPVNDGRRYGFAGVGLAGDWPGGWTQTYSQFNTEAGPHGFDEDYFVRQVAGLAQIAGEMMLVAPIVVDLAWGELKSALLSLPDSAFVSPSGAQAAREGLVNQYVAAFGDVEFGFYRDAKEKLAEMQSSLNSLLTPTSRTALAQSVAQLIQKVPDH